MATGSPGLGFFRALGGMGSTIQPHLCLALVSSVPLHVVRAT